MNEKQYDGLLNLLWLNNILKFHQIQLFWVAQFSF